MGILQRFSGGVMAPDVIPNVATKASVQQSLINEFESDLSPESIDTRFSRFVDIYRSPFTYIAIRHIAEACAQARLQVFEQTVSVKPQTIVGADGEITTEPGQEVKMERLHNHRVERVWQKANAEDCGRDLMVEFIHNQMIHGAGFFETVRDGNGAVKEMYGINASRMTPVPDPTNKVKIAGWEFEVDGKKNPVSIPARKIIYAPLFHPAHDFLGYAPAATALSKVQQDEAASQFRTRFYKNGAH